MTRDLRNSIAKKEDECLSQEEEIQFLASSPVTQANNKDFLPTYSLNSSDFKFSLTGTLCSSHKKLVRNSEDKTTAPESK